MVPWSTILVEICVSMAKQTAVNIDDNDPEIKTEKKASALVMKTGELEKLEESISSWVKLVGVVSRIINMKKLLLIRLKKGKIKYCWLVMNISKTD